VIARRSGDTAHGRATDTEAMKEVHRRKTVLAIVLASLVFSSAYASAATFGSSTKPFVAGNAPTASCAPSLSVSFTVAYDATLTGYRVSGVHVGPLGACAGKTIEITLTGAAGTPLRQLSYTVKSSDAAAGRMTVPVGGSVNASSVSGVSVALAG